MKTRSMKGPMNGCAPLIFLRSFSDRTHVSILVCVAALILFVGIGHKQLWVDEIVQVIHSRPTDLRQFWHGVSQDSGSAPLDYLVESLSLSLFQGSPELSARAHAAFFSVFSVLILYRIATLLFLSHGVALRCASLFTVYPLFHHYAQEGRPYALFLFLTLCLYLMFYQFLTHPRLKWVGCHFLLATLSFYAHPYTAYVILSQVVIAVCIPCSPRAPFSSVVARVLPLILSGAAAVVCFLPWLMYSFANAHGREPFRLEPKLGLRIIQELADGSYPLAILLLLFAGIGVYSLVIAQKREPLIFLVGWMLIPVPLIFAALIWRDYFFATRQLLFVTPALYLLVGIGITHLRNHTRLPKNLPTIVLFVISIGVLVLHYPDKRDDFRGAGYFLHTTLTPTDTVVAPQIEGILEFYVPTLRNHFQRPMKIEASDRFLPESRRVVFVDSRYNRDKTCLMWWQSRGIMTTRVRMRGIDIYCFDGSRALVSENPPQAKTAALRREETREGAH